MLFLRDSTTGGDGATMSADGGKDEASFRRTMGVKAKIPEASKRRSCSEEPRRALAMPAGNHGRKLEIDLETAPYHAQRRVFTGNGMHRSEAAMTLAPDVN